MRAIADGELGPTRTFAEEMAYCLGCLACTTACPAGVDYGTLFEAARAEADRSGAQSGPLRSIVRFATAPVPALPALRAPVCRQAPAMASRRADFAAHPQVGDLFNPAGIDWRLESQMLTIRSGFSVELIAGP
jgi:ferredoxin